MFGLSIVERKRVRKPGLVESIVAPAVWSLRWAGTVTRPLIVSRSAGRLGEIRSITWSRSASVSVRFEARFTARLAQAALRSWLLARPRSDAAASLITLRRRSLPMFAPVEEIGVEEPMFVSGAIASTSAASEIQTPAEAARAPPGET